MGLLLPPALLRRAQLPLSPNAFLAGEIRAKFRGNDLCQPTARLAPGFLQANLAVLERQHALDFLVYVLRNPGPMPLLDVCPRYDAVSLAPGSDLRTDLPLYRVWDQGQLVREARQVADVWPENAVAFLLGCSFSFDPILRPLLAKFSAQCDSVPMFKTNLQTERSGVFAGGMVVSMRLVPEKNVHRVTQLTREMPLAHGAPIAIGIAQAREMGIKDILHPDFGVAPTSADLHEEGVIPMFWPCGVTPQIAIQTAQVSAITHAPGHMFISDVNVNDIVLPS